MFLITGLGNPGEEYIKTRHNVGFLLLDKIAGDVSWQKDKYADAEYWQGDFEGSTTIFLKPLTFMNLSGKSVKEFMKKDGIDMNRFVVIHDDIDLPIGSFKISYDRGSGGHNGIKSIISDLEDNAFLRIRIGIAPVDEEGITHRPEDTANFVLKEFSKGDLEKVFALAPRIRAALQTFMEFGREVMMNKFN